MRLNINFTDGSSQNVNLDDSFKWDKRELQSDGNRRLSNIKCLVYDLCSPHKELLSYTLTSINGKVLDKWRI